MEKILIVEDDRDLMEGLCYSFREDGYEIRRAFCRKQAEEEFYKNHVDLILLDCNLPDGSGFEFCQKVRESCDVPVFMLTARDAEMDEVKALNLGVDDYMRKPFSLAVLKARIQNLLRRKDTSEFIKAGSILIDKNNCRILRDGEEIKMTAIEYRLLRYLVENKGQILSKEQILAQIWDKEGIYPDDNIVSVNIRRLRMKVEDDPGNAKYIQTVYGMGYIWRNI